MMKVLMTADTVGGVWTYVINLAAALAPHGVEVVVAAMGGTPRPHQLAQAKAAAPGLRIIGSDFPLEWMPDPWNGVERAGAWLMRLQDELRPDLVHLNNYAHAGLDWRAPVIVVAHSCVVTWWNAVHGEDPPAAFDRYRAVVGAGLRAADAIVAPTAAMGRALQRAYDLDACPAVIYNGARVERSSQEAKAAAPSRTPCVLAAGRMWDEAKNLRLLQQAAELGLPCPIRVAGPLRQDEPMEVDRHEDREHRDAAQALRSTHDARTEGNACAEFFSLNMLGPLPHDELQREMRSAALYCLPARYEPFGLSILEAAAGGCALVLGDIATLRELWHDAALFVDPDDPAALREAITHLIQDTAARTRLAHAAVERADQFQSSSMARGYLALYRRHTAEPRPIIDRSSAETRRPRKSPRPDRARPADALSTKG